MTDNTLNSSNIDISAMADYKNKVHEAAEGINKMSMTAEEMKKALNVPERDTSKYPMLTEQDQMAAGAFMYKLNLMASSEVDGNLQSLVWELYSRLNDYLHLDKENASINLAMSLERLKSYMIESNNPVFKDNLK